MPKACIRATSIAAFVATAAMLCATSAGASRAANAKERRALTQAVHASPVGGINKVPAATTASAVSAYPQSASPGRSPSSSRHRRSGTAFRTRPCSRSGRPGRPAGSSSTSAPPRSGAGSHRTRCSQTCSRPRRPARRVRGSADAGQRTAGWPPGPTASSSISAASRISRSGASSRSTSGSDP